MKPFFILNISNVNFLFAYLNDNGYRYGFDEEPSEIDNDALKQEILDNVQIRSKEEEIRILYMELDEEIKRYVIISKWFTKRYLKNHYKLYEFLLNNVIRMKKTNFRVFLNKRKGPGKLISQYYDK